MDFAELKHHRDDLALTLTLFVAFIAGSWSVSISLPFVLAGLLFVLLRLRTQDKPVPFHAVDLAVLAVGLYELYSYAVSLYRPNSLFGLENILFWLALYFLLRYGLRKSLVKTLFALALSAYALMLVLTALGNYMSLDGYLRVQGWADISEFKGFLNYFKLFLNNWATLSVCLLPFPLIAAIHLRANRMAFYGALFVFCMSVLAVLISFSRGAYLSLFVFGILCTGVLLLIAKDAGRRLVLPGLFTGGLLTLILLLFYRPVSNTLAMNKTTSQQRSTHGRLNILESGLCKSKIYWLSGTGTHNYPLSPDDCFREEEDSGYSVFTNNLYLQILIEKGLPGFLIYGALFFLVLWRFFINLLRSPEKKDRLTYGFLFAGFAAYAFRELFFSSFFESSQVLALVSLFAAYAADGSPVLFTLRRNSGYSVAAGLLVLVSAWFFIHQLNGRGSERKVEQALVEWKNGNAGKAATLIGHAIKLSPVVFPYHELQGLALAQDSLSIRKLFAGNLQVDRASLSNAKSHFLRALQINPADAGVHFNLGVLEFLQSGSLAGVPASHFIRALEREPNNVEFMVGFGMLAEYSGNAELADRLYKKAVRLDPELIDSEFFSDLKHRNPSSDSLLIGDAVAALRSKIDSSYNMIFLARLARLLMAGEDSAGIKNMLEEVIRNIPTAHRPYFYLGQLAENGADSSRALDLYRKSFFLGKEDYLAPLALGNYYYSKMVSSPSRSTALSAARYYRLALITYLEAPSLHHKRAKAQYKVSASIVNDLLFKDLMYYTRARMDFRTIVSRMAESYEKGGDANMAGHYRKMEGRDLMDVEMR
ncbi:MAG TPA: O-antigen ligase family protein [Saprospiraceae bacterium]|nr:O-antigen ligase family protein [Saprospiraceae bacterium]HNT21441.1 O-antigen ligase family protein [Saprospiraceae bacterium]